MKGFTLVELMVVILIIAILAAASIPLLRGSVDSAKWSEGKATMGTIATALRIYMAIEREDFEPVPTLEKLGVAPWILDGTYFKGGDSSVSDFSWVITGYDPIEYVITAKALAGVKSPSEITLNASGKWSITP